MFRKFSKSSLHSKPAAASTPLKTSAQTAPNQLAWPRKRLQTGIKTASESNLPSNRKIQKDHDSSLALKPGGTTAREARGRRVTIATSGQPGVNPTVSAPKRSTPTQADIQPRKIVSYMPEL